MLWIGLLACGYTFWRTRDIAFDAFTEMSGAGWLFAVVLLLLVWGLAVSGWKIYLLAFTGRLPSWRTAIRQVGLLLIGKYVPGGVFGFIARIYDQANASRRQLFWAGVTEQAVAITMSLVVGGALYFSAIHTPKLLFLVLAFPLLAVVGVALLHRFLALLPWAQKYISSTPPSWRRLFFAILIQLMQVVTWAGLVVMLSQQFYGIGAQASLGVAGAFLVAVAAGMIVILVPGGIGVREAALVALSSSWIGVSSAIFLAACLRLLSSLLDVFSGITAIMSGREGEG